MGTFRVLAERELEKRTLFDKFAGANLDAVAKRKRPEGVASQGWLGAVPVSTDPDRCATLRPLTT